VKYFLVGDQMGRGNVILKIQMNHIKDERGYGVVVQSSKIHDNILK
jgi:hypothetical protein